jgi:hypothetical protein
MEWRGLAVRGGCSSGVEVKGFGWYHVIDTTRFLYNGGDIRSSGLVCVGQREFCPWLFP